MGLIFNSRLPVHTSRFVNGKEEGTRTRQPARLADWAMTGCFVSHLISLITNPSNLNPARRARTGGGENGVSREILFN
jgi:hypothetical protein